MNGAELFTTWYIWLGIFAVIILIAAALLIAIWLAARRILKLAVAALDLVKQIKANTQSIWKLEETNQVAGAILDTAKSIHEHGGEVAEALHASSAEEAKEG